MLRCLAIDVDRDFVNFRSITHSFNLTSELISRTLMQVDSNNSEQRDVDPDTPLSQVSIASRLRIPRSSKVVWYALYTRRSALGFEPPCTSSTLLSVFT